MFVELAFGQMVFICNSLLVSRLLGVSQDPELPREPWLGTLVLVAGFLQRKRYIEADRICEGVKTVTHLSEASQ